MFSIICHFIVLHFFLGFDDVDDYLDIQFRLLREDFVGTLRNGIKELKESKESTNPRRARLGDIKVYRDLRILGPNFGGSGITHFIA